MPLPADISRAFSFLSQAVLPADEYHIDGARAMVGSDSRRTES